MNDLGEFEMKDIIWIIQAENKSETFLIKVFSQNYVNFFGLDFNNTLIMH